MPAAVAIPIALAAGTATAGIVSSRMQSGASNRAAQLQSDGNAASLAFLREQEAERKREYDQQRAEQKAQWDAEQARLAPYRQFSKSVLDWRAAGAPMAPPPPGPKPLTIGSLR